MQLFQQVNPLTLHRLVLEKITGEFIAGSRSLGARVNTHRRKLASDGTRMTNEQITSSELAEFGDRWVRKHLIVTQKWLKRRTGIHGGWRRNNGSEGLIPGSVWTLSN